MKKTIKKIVILISAISVILVMLTSIDLLNLGISVSLKSEHANFIQENEIITEVKFTAPPNFNVVQLDPKEETVYDEIGNLQQVITTYGGSVKKLFSQNESSISIKVSESIEYVYIFNFSDKTVIIKNGVFI